MVPTGSHTSPNPAKICAKLNQSILEMALVSFCQRNRLQGTKGSGCGGGGGLLSLPNTSKVPTVSDRGKEETHTHTFILPNGAHGTQSESRQQPRCAVNSTHVPHPAWPVCSCSPHWPSGPAHTLRWSLLASPFNVTPQSSGTRKAPGKLMTTRAGVAGQTELGPSRWVTKMMTPSYFGAGGEGSGLGLGLLVSVPGAGGS